MMAHLTRRRVVTVVILTFAWCALWGEASIANILSGSAVATAVSSTTIGTPARGWVRLGPLVRFAGLVFFDLIKSTVAVAGEVLTPTDRTDEAIIHVQLPGESRLHLLLLIVAVTVTPGTAVVDADPDTGALYLHLLHAERRRETEEHVRTLAELACAALPVRPVATPEEVSS